MPVFRPKSVLTLLCVGMMTPAAAFAAPAPSETVPGALQCVVLTRAAAEQLQASQGDSGAARALGMKASQMEEQYRANAMAGGLDPFQVEIALAAERESFDAHQAAKPGALPLELRAQSCIHTADASDARRN